MFRFPKNLVDIKTLQQYDYFFESQGDYEHSIKVSQQGQYVVVDIEERKAISLLSDTEKTDFLLRFIQVFGKSNFMIYALFYH